MAEYIKRMSAMTICERYSQHCFETNDNRGQDIADRIFDEITEIPTADVVEVVRCKDCRHWGDIAYGFICRKFSGIDTKICMGTDQFCSYGELKEREG
jgi:hypothetical protein